jgi:hypothetical protein
MLAALGRGSEMRSFGRIADAQPCQATEMAADALHRRINPSN